MRLLALLATAFALTAAVADARPLATLRVDEVTGLQGRLVDAGCWRGPVDGRASKALEDAAAACPEQEPELRIETGMHTGAIRRVAADAACRVAATGSDDKTVRLWSLADGRLMRTLRLPSGTGAGGKVYTVAMSSDGRYVAAGGWDASWEKTRKTAVYLYNLGDGSIRRIGAFDSTVRALAFSPDGRRIAAALGGDGGIRVLDRDSGRVIRTDAEYGADSYGVAWGPDGSLYATSFDGQIRRYGPDLRRTHKVAARGRLPFGVAVSPDGRRLAVGYNDQTRPTLYDAARLTPVAETATSDVRGTLTAVAWTRDGTLQVAGGASRLFNGAWRRYARPLTADGQSAGADVALAADGILDLTPCGDGFLWAAADPAFGLVTNGVSRVIGTKRSPDMRDKSGEGLTVSPDGRLVRFGLANAAADPVLFDLSAATLTADPEGRGLARAITSGLDVADWLNSLAPKLNGRPIALEPNEMARSLAVHPARSGFALAAEYSLRFFDAFGAERWRRDVPGVAWGVNFAQGGNLVVAAFGDGTLRWFRGADGVELLALYIDAPTKRWVAWTPTGYYMAAPGGEDLIGWHLNRGWTDAPDFFSAARFRDKFSRPDVVQRILDTLDEGRAVEAADVAARKRPAPVKPIIAELPPVVAIATPRDGDGFQADEVTVAYRLRTPSGQAVERVDVLIDGRPVPEARGLARPDAGAGAGAAATAVAASDERRVTVRVPKKDVEITLIARAGAMVSEPATVRLAYSGRAAVAPASQGEANLLKPRLYGLVIGVADYVDPSLKLGFAAKDARDFAAALNAQGGALYGAVDLRVLTDRDATREAILDGLEWLEKQVTSRDVGIVFLAGHGINDERQTFWFLPADAAPERLRQRAISHDDIRRTLQALAGKAILFLDACHAGRAATAMVTTRGATDINAVINEFSSAETGVVTFASSTGRELSRESPEWGNGAFTKALVEGIAEGKADLLGQGTITLSQLDAFVVNRVKELTGGAQHAVMTRPPTIGDYPIAVRQGAVAK